MQSMIFDSPYSQPQYDIKETKGSYEHKTSQKRGPPAKPADTIGEKEFGKDGHTLYETRSQKNGLMKWYIVRSSDNSVHQHPQQKSSCLTKPNRQGINKSSHTYNKTNAMDLEDMQIVHTNNNAKN